MQQGRGEFPKREAVKRRKPCTVRPSCSVVDEEWQRGQFMSAFLYLKGGENLSARASPDKLP